MIQTTYDVKRCYCLSAVSRILLLVLILSRLLCQLLVVLGLVGYMVQGLGPKLVWVSKQLHGWHVECSEALHPKP